MTLVTTVAQVQILAQELPHAIDTGPPHTHTHRPKKSYLLERNKDEMQLSSTQHPELSNPSPEVLETTLVPSMTSSILQTHVFPISPFGE